MVPLLSGWRKAISAWVKLTRPEDMLAVDIFFDFEPVWGQVNLASQLHQAMEKALRKPDFLKVLAGNLGNSHAGSTFFGGFKTEAGRYNMKLWNILPLVETLRVLAISRGISKRSSAEQGIGIAPDRHCPAGSTPPRRGCSLLSETGAAATNCRYLRGHPAGTMIDLGLLSETRSRC